MENPNSVPSIMVLVNDRRSAGQIQTSLTGAGFRVIVHGNNQEALEKVFDSMPDLLLMEIESPSDDNLAFCRRLRPRFNRPILLLTDSDAEEDEVLYSESGADDFLKKPVRPRRLLTRVNTLLGRHLRIRLQARVMELSSLTIDAAHMAVKQNGNWIRLTSAEFELLWLLAGRAGEAMSRDEVCRQLRGFDYNGLDRTIDLRIARLRRKLGDNAKRPFLIQSVRGIGYMLAP